MKFLACFYCLVVCSMASAQIIQIGYDKPAKEPPAKKPLSAKSGYTSPKTKFDFGISQDQAVLAVLNTKNGTSSFQRSQELKPISLAVKDSLLRSPLRVDGALNVRPRHESSDIILRDVTRETLGGVQSSHQSTSDITRPGLMVSGSHRSLPVSMQPSSVTIEGAARVQIVRPQPAQRFVGRTRWFLGRRMQENRLARQSARGFGCSGRSMASCSNSRAAACSGRAGW